jgi:non-heme chloroperoxidase
VDAFSILFRLISDHTVKLELCYKINGSSMSYLETGTGHVYFEDHPRIKGTTEQGTLLLVHGWGMSVRCWDPILPALVGGGYRVVSIDHRGCGLSDKDFDDMSISAIAGDVVALVEHLALEKVVLNGWSLGGAVVVEAASLLGESCVALVLTGGATPLYTQKDDFEFGGTDEDVAGTLQAYENDRLNFLQGLSTIICVKDVGAHIEDWMYRIFLEASPRAGATLAGLAQLDQREMLMALDMPIISLFGSEDGFVAPPICRWVGEHHPRAQLAEFPGVGHAPFIEERKGYLAALFKFLGEAQ